MSGLSFPSKGPGVVAARGPWFGLVPDKFNLLFSGNIGGGGYPVVNSPNPANFGNQFELHQATLGGFITAPDGTTNTMQLIQEDNSNNRHYGQCVMLNNQFTMFGAQRLAVFASSGGRRMILNVWESPGGNTGGVRAVFDLAGGQIGQAVAAWGNNTPTSGNTFLPYDAQIFFVGTFLGNAVYLCWMDFGFYNQDAGGLAPQYSIDLDNGTGTAVASPSYTGNGTSGVYVWKTTMLPAGAWCLNTQTFFDDFTSSSTIDMANSLAPGFNWYRQCTFNGLFPPTGGNTNNPTPTSAFSVAGSVLTLNSTNSWNSGNDNQIMLTSAAQLNSAAGTYVGRGFNYPALIEYRGSYNFGTAANYHVSMWGGGLEWCMRNLATNNPVLTSYEHDLAPDVESGAIYPKTGALFWPNPGAPGGGLANPIGLGSPGVCFIGPGPYSATITYLSGDTCVFSGQQYYNSGVAQTMPTPPAGNWVAVNYPASFAFPQLSVDYTQMHTYSNLIIPVRYPGWKGPNSQQSAAIGFSFFDGAGCGGSSSNHGAQWGWRPSGGPVRPATASASSDYQSSVEWQQQILWINTGVNTCSIDWIKVTQ